tara:strand:+ start:866 stop:1528 length:663 start_codon:yes stop_codon:yes gene_type:complete
MTIQTMTNSPTIVKKKSLPRRTTIHTTTPSNTIEDEDFLASNPTPSNTPDSPDTGELFTQLEKAQSTTNDLINQVDKDSSIPKAEDSSIPDQEDSPIPEEENSAIPDEEDSAIPEAEDSTIQEASKIPQKSPNSLMSRKELEAELDRISSELKEEKKKNTRKSYAKGELEIKVSKKGAIQINGLRKLPITIYRQEWERLFPIIDKIKQFIVDHPDELTTI